MIYSILIPVATFTAGYLLRGWLAVLWERKREQHDTDATTSAGSCITSQLQQAMPEIFHLEENED